MKQPALLANLILLFRLANPCNLTLALRCRSMGQSMRLGQPGLQCRISDKVRNVVLRENQFPGFPWLKKRILPDGLFRPGLPLGPLPVVEVTGLPLSASGLDEARAAGRHVTLVLSATLFHERRISLPMAAANHAARAIELELRQSMPRHAAGLIWGIERVLKTKDRIEYRVLIAKEAPVAQVIEDLAKIDTRVERVTAGSAEGPQLWSRQPDTGAGKDRQWLLLTILLVLGIAFGKAFMLQKEATALAELAQARQARISELENRKVLAEEASRLSESGRAEVAAAARIFALHSQRLRILTDLSEVFPDDTWVSELTISGHEMFIEGFARRDVAELVVSLQSLPWVESVSLSGATTFDHYSEQSRFSLSIALALTGAEE
jgi:Tfp pilus assembly protein PilN